ncbi:MAG TPA: glycosyl transferase family 1, partial [Cyanobacteria bacterium UBA11049]|nr:glycosyl transferase family 1 [Cyanobacteria bacterium UBA11049]
QESSGSLDIVVSPKFLQEHSDVVKLATEINKKDINFVAITREEEANLKLRTSGINRNLRAFQEWQLFCKYADLLKSTQCLIMYFDPYQLPLAVGMKVPCSFSGIYFRPTFHYPSFSHYIPSWKNRLQQWKEKFILSRVLRHPQLKTLFCLDPFAVKQINNFAPQPKAIYLPDPVLVDKNECQLKNLRETLEINPSKKVFLLFGSLNGRKGIYQLLDAIQLLPSALCEQICLVFVGEANPTDKASIAAKVAATCQARPVQIIEHYEFVSEQDVPAYFQLADVVLAPYQRHVGMSGILLLAAAANKPVLSSNYGLMGEIVQRYQLGIVVDSTVPKDIAQGLQHCLVASGEELGDRKQMQLFAEQNSAEKFAENLFQYGLKD